jgi:hypothetical protein
MRDIKLKCASPLGQRMQRPQTSVYNLNPNAITRNRRDFVCFHDFLMPKQNGKF